MSRRQDSSLDIYTSSLYCIICFHVNNFFYQTLYILHIWIKIRMGWSKIILLFSSSSSSSCRAISADISDPLSPPLPIVHCFRQVFRATSPIGAKLLYVGLSWSSCLYSPMWRGPQEYITYELVPTFPAVSHMSGSSNFDSFRGGW